MANTHLTNTFGAGNAKTFTTSFWMKRGTISNAQMIFYKDQDAGSPYEYHMNAYLDANDRMYIARNNGATICEVITTRKFRDTNAWYHIVIETDTTQATASDRVKLWVNGVQETAFDSSNYPAQNTNLYFNQNGQLHRIGTGDNAGGTFFDGSLAHFHFIDGATYNADTFGSTDSTTGIWKPTTSPTISDYGTNGFFLDFADSSAMGNDVSGKNNDWTVNGAGVTQTIDTPSNVFATWNALANHNNSITLTNGNTTGQSPFTGGFGGIATLGMQDGKYYMECKLISESSANEAVIGVGADLEQDDISGYIQGQAQHFGLRNNNGQKHENGTTTNSVHGSYTTGDIMGMAFDGATKKLTFSKNGGWWNGTSTWTGTSPDFTTHYLDCSGGSYDTFFFEIGDAGSTVNVKWSCNFGNGYFGTTAVASAGTNSGIGTFEYDVPSGYKALCTKSINEQEYS